MLFPRDEGELAAILARSQLENVPVTISGQRTGVSGGAVPEGGDVVSMQHLDRIIGVGKDEVGFYIRVEAAVTLDRLDRLLASQRYDSIADLTPDARRLLREEGRHLYPVDPTETNASLGANVACNSSGSRSFRYGPTRDWVRGLRVVLPDGRALGLTRGSHRAEDGVLILDDDGREQTLTLPSHAFNHAVKNSAGYFSTEDMDPVDLFIGSEGTLGVVTVAELRLVRWEPRLSVMAFLPDDRAALAFAASIRSLHERPDLIEFIDSEGIYLLESIRETGGLLRGLPPFPDMNGAAVLFDIAYDGDARGRIEEISALLEKHGSSLEKTWCGHDDGDRRRFKALRHAVPEAVFSYIASRKNEHPQMHKVGTDISVPDAAAEEMMSLYRRSVEASGIRSVLFGHVGDNHPHLEMLIGDMGDFSRAKAIIDDLVSKAVELGGSPCAEHGVGRLKRGYLSLMYPPEAVEAMRHLKRSLDPNMTLNRNVLFEVGD